MPRNILPSLVDTHCHLDFPEFDADRQDVVDACRALQINHIVVPGISFQCWPSTLSVCQQFENTHFALGMHPIFVDDHQPHHLVELDEQVKKFHPIAIGEIGLDYRPAYIDNHRQEKQTTFFTKQLFIAQKHQLPVIIHCVKAHDNCISLLNQYSPPGGVIHAFNGSIQQAEKYISLGFCLGIGGMLTYERSRKLRSLVREIPLQHLVLETDAPDMSVAKHRGRRNSPVYIPDVQLALAEVKQTTPDEVANITTKNAIRIFGERLAR